jgi:nicotinamide riboside transporter PnuC
MCYVARAGLYFAPVVFLLLLAWAHVRSQTLSDQEEAAKSRGRRKIWLICLIASIVIFGALTLAFPIPV